jgi:hypothetical protein
MKTEIPELKKRVEEMLNDAIGKHQKGFYLRVVDHRSEDDWIHLFVQPDRPNINAEEYVRVLAEVETSLEDKNPDVNLLLVPVAPAEAEA